MEVFLQFDDRAEVKLNDTIGWHIPRKGDTLTYEPDQGGQLAGYDVVNVVNCVDFRLILSKVQVVLREERVASSLLGIARTVLHTLPPKALTPRARCA